MSSTSIARLFRAEGRSNSQAGAARKLQGRPVSKIELNNQAYTAGIAKALRDDYADSSMVKTICEETGASVGAVKNWLAEVNGPGGEHLIKLMAASSSVRRFIDRTIGREDALAKAERRLHRIIELMGADEGDDGEVVDLIPSLAAEVDAVPRRPKAPSRTERIARRARVAANGRAA